MAHFRVHLLSPNVNPDAIPFGPNTPDPRTSVSESDPSNFGPNCVGCISTQNLANGAVTTPKIAPGAVSMSTIEAQGDTLFLRPGTAGTANVGCPSGSVATGGAYETNATAQIAVSQPTSPPGWTFTVVNPATSNGVIFFNPFAVCATIHP